jgi:hypothetical protein
VVLDGLKELLEAAKKDRGRLGENRGELESWRELLPFSNRPEATLEVLELLEAQFCTPWRLHRVLEALRDAPDLQSERILAELARRDPRVFAGYEWVHALLKRGTLSAVLMVVDVAREGNRVLPDPHSTFGVFQKRSRRFSGLIPKRERNCCGNTRPKATAQRRICLRLL